MLATSLLLLGALPPAAFGQAHPLFAGVVQDAPPGEAPATVVLELKNQSRIRGTLLEETPDAYRLASPELGELSIPKASVQAVLPADAPLGPPPPAALAPPPPGLLGTQVLAGWEKSIELGFSGKSGTADSLDLYGKISGDYSDEQRRWRVRAAYFYGLTESDNTKNEGFANARRDWLGFNDPWFFFAEARSDYNEFQAYRFRAGGFLGVGYNFVKKEELDVIGRVGAGASYEFGEVDELVPEALLALEVRWQVAENQRFDFINTLFPDLRELGEYRNVTEASYTVNLQRGRGVSLKVGVQNEYDSHTEDASDHNSLTYFGAMVFAF
jgi:putative salt-induced outer membrane protein YdiY